MTTRERDALGRFVAYVNYECPDECNRDHDEPDPNGEGQWTCPTTGQMFVRDDGEWVLPRRWHNWSTYVDAADEWYVDPAEHGWSQCSYCSDFVSDERIRSDDWGDYYCRECDYDDDDDCYSGRTPSFTAPACEVCGHRVDEVTHYEPITDRVACEECGDSDSPQTQGFVRIPTFELVAA